MIDFDDALKCILEEVQPLGKVRKKTENLVGSYLAEPVTTPFPSPRFDNSAMDGFGVSLQDVQQASPSTPVKLILQDEICAGDAGAKVLKQGHAFKIFTGAPVPKGVEAVIMREDCEDLPNQQVLIRYSPKAGENIRCKGEEFQKNQIILPAGTLVTPAVTGLLSSLGYTAFFVTAKPKVTFVLTGNELIKPGMPLKKGQIYDSNRDALQLATRLLGISHCSAITVKDSPVATQKALEKALQQSDVIIPVGGVSVGDYDFVKASLTNLGVKPVFWKVAIKPGKPFYFGTYQPSTSKHRKKLIFGLPGNPVSALITFHLLVKPALLKLTGNTQPEPLKLRALLQGQLKKKPGRMEFVRGLLSQTHPQGELLVSPSNGQDSHMLSGLATANCLIHFPKDLDTLSHNQTVAVEML